MGKRGPRPTPSKILEARGSWRAGTNEAEPQPEQAINVKPPSWLKAEARGFWIALVPELERLGLLTKIDLAALSRYCTAWAQWREAEKFIAENGFVYTIKDDKGKAKCVVQWPQVGIANRLSAQLLRLEQEFGLTPSARTRVAANIQPDKPKQKPTDRPPLRIAQ